MASAGDIHSILYRGDVLNKPFQPKFNPTKKVKRHFPGQVPDYVSENAALVERLSENGSGDESELKHIEDDWSEDELQGSIENLLSNSDISEVARPVKRRRREVIKQADSETLNDQNAESLVSVPSKVESCIGQAQDADAAFADRRERMRQKALEERRKEEEKLDESIREIAVRESLNQIEEEEDESEAEEEEEELDVVKPIFIPAALRESLKEKQTLDIEENKEAERQKQELEERRKESRKLLVECVQLEEQEEELRINQPTDFSLEPNEMPDDSDTIDEESEYQLWKIRELKRIKRDREEEETHLKELLQIERRRQMTDEERREDDRRLDAKRGDQPKKGKYAFLQKYYHKGAFFQDLASSESLYLRDFNKCVGEDAVDKKALPKPMQVRRGQFGKAGQVKHTHLAAEDTTDFSSAWVQISRHNAKLQEKMAGAKGINQLERPSAKLGGDERREINSGNKADRNSYIEQKQIGTAIASSQNNKKYEFTDEISRREKPEFQYYENQIERGAKHDINKDYTDDRAYYVNHHNSESVYSFNKSRGLSDREREKDRKREIDEDRERWREKCRERENIREREKDYNLRFRGRESDRERENVREREKQNDYKSDRYDRHYR